jgi:hypothetical protein
VEIAGEWGCGQGGGFERGRWGVGRRDVMRYKVQLTLEGK